MRMSWIAFGLLALAPLSGALRRPALNDRCEPLADVAMPLDLSTRSGRLHLYRDASFAEELAIRYADVTASHQAGNFKTWAIYNGNRDECMARLFDTVVRLHSVSLDDVRRAVNDRDLAIDVVLFVTFLLAFSIAITPAMAALTTRFAADPPIVRSVALAATSLALSLVGWFTGRGWFTIHEMLRLSNTHMSYRVQRVTWTHGWTLPVATLVCVLALAWFVRIRARRFQGISRPR
jgi:hypothetical protein